MTEVDWEGVSAENLEEVSESRADRVMKLIDAITTEIREAHKTKYEMEAAERTAALCLEAQRELAEFLADAE
ncbi:MAG TPA: hypothetical protein VMW91_00130, partial [Desulfosporosinus sp.]|nr:hypothetical protein [Desulfosporosinus sp.]